MRPPRVGLPLLVAAGLVVGCGVETVSDWAGTIEERDGVVWVNNPAPVADAEPAFGLELEQTFGAEEEPEQAILSSITGVTIDDAGNVYVVDRSDSRIVAFGPGGGLLWARGRAGQGPGELDNAGRIAWDGDQLLYVDNHGGAQIDTWTVGGEYVDSLGLTAFDISQGYVVGLPDPGTLVLWSWSRIHGDGAGVHVLRKRPEGWRRVAEFFALGGRRATSEEPSSWAQPTLRARGDAIWVGNRLRYEVREYALDGALRRVVARDHPELIPYFVYKGTGFGLGEFEAPLWITDDLGLVLRYWIEGAADAEDLKRRWDEALASGGLDDDFRRFQGAIDLIDAQGRVLGTNLLPPGAPWETLGTLEAVGADGRLYTQVHDPYPHVRRYRVEYPRVAS